jgi:hypothetical protein
MHKRDCKMRLNPIDTPQPPPERSAELLSLLQSWIDAGDETEQRETGDYLIRVLDEDRLSDRPLYPQELKGISW